MDALSKTGGFMGILYSFATFLVSLLQEKIFEAKIFKKLFIFEDCELG